LRTVFLGTSDFAVDVLRRLARAGAAPALVVTPVDRPQGRRRRLLPPPAATAAGELGLALHQTANVNDPQSLAAVRAARPELALVCAFGQIIRDPLLSELEMLNIHPSLLPRWRGAAPIERAIMAGDERTGLTIARVTEGLDAGPIALAEPVEIAADEDYGSLSARLAESGANLALEALRRREAGTLELTDQDETGSTYAEKIAPSDRRLDPARSAEELARTVRAFHPHIGAYLGLAGGEPLGIAAAQAEPGSLATGSMEAEGDRLLLGCAEGVLRVDRLRPAGGREMDAGAYLRGHPVPVLDPAPR
jgi:methionyl-tRNA formyltransferase